MNSELRILRQWPLFLLATLMAHCGGSSPNTAASPDLPSGGTGGGTDASVEPDATAPLSDAGASNQGMDVASVGAPRLLPSEVDDAGHLLPLFAADSSPLRVADCTPGTYSGPFDTLVIAGSDGGYHDAAILEWKGTLTITLVANHSVPQFGEFNSTVLTVAAGAHLSGTDNIGGTFDADIKGQLDCATRMFVGTIFNGTYTGFAVLFQGSTNIMLGGSLAGTYDPTANPVARPHLPQERGEGRQGG